MANDDKIGTIVNDPDFQTLGLADQQQFLSKVDPDFAKLKQGEFSTFLARYKGSQQSPEQQQIAQLPNAAMQAKQQTQLPVGLQPTERTIQYAAGGMPQFVDVPKGQGQAYQQAGQAGNATGVKVGLASLAIPEAIAAPAATGLALAGGAVGGAAGKYGGRKAAQAAGGGKEAQDISGDVGEFLGGLLGGATGIKGAGMLPNASRAGATMNQIVGANKDVPVPSFEATSAAVRAKEIFQAGAPSFPAPMRKFLVRVMDPDKPPLTVGEARDFYTASSKQTAKEWSEMSAPMKRQMAQFTSALGDNIEQALNAKTPGAGTNLRQAMDEYHGAMQVKTNAQKLLKWGGGAIGGDLLVRSILKRYGGK